MLRPRAVADPYPLCDRLREIAPVLAVTLPGTAAPTCLLSGFAHCSRILRDARFAPLHEHHHDARIAGWREHPFSSSMLRSMAFRTGAAHRSRRALVARHFTPRMVAGRRDQVARVGDALLERLARRGAGGTAVDLQAELADPYASLVIGRLLGIPDARALRLGRLTRQVGAVFEVAPSVAQRRQMAVAGDELHRGLVALIRERRRRPRDDLLSDLVAGPGAADEETLTREIVLLFGAGIDSPASLVGLGTRLFLDHPDQARAVREDPAVAGSAAAEVLRYEPPIQMISRVATEQARFADVTVPRGSLVVGLVPAANRDPAYVSEPDRFDVRRPPAPGLGFGGGAHYCLGASIARLQGELLFPRLLRRFPHMEPAGPPRYRSPGSALRGLAHLPVRLGPA